MDSEYLLNMLTRELYKSIEVNQSLDNAILLYIKKFHRTNLEESGMTIFVNFYLDNSSGFAGNVPYLSSIACIYCENPCYSRELNDNITKIRKDIERSISPGKLLL